jgi:3-hydroxyacyl-[acyl-carrier-protein] dehydratase
MSSASPTTNFQMGQEDGGDRAGRAFLFDISRVDLTQRLYGRERIGRLNPHRFEMALLDWVVWHEADYTRGVGLKVVRADEFWVKGHFPARPMYPGVLMIETAAQLASLMYNSRFTEPTLPVFARIEHASFRAAVHPGDELYVLCQDVKFSTKRFVTDVQGLVAGRVAFEARITGISGGRFAAE